MSLSTNTTYRVLVEKLGSSDPNQFIGNEGEVFYDPSIPALKLSDGSTTGGLTIGGGGGGGESYWSQTSAGINTLSNVGIGTTNPTEKLTVFGDARVTGILTVGTASITLDGNTNIINVGSGVTIDGSTGTIEASSIVIEGTTFTGAAVTSITAGSGISVDQSTGNVTITATGGGGGGESYWVSTATGIHTTSNVGIGTTNPQTKLEINGVLGFGTFDNSGTRTNIRIGDNTTGANLTSGYDNIFMGIGAGNSTTSGCYNNFFGFRAGRYNTTGTHNNFFGKEAGRGRRGRITTISITTSTTLAGEADNSYSNVSGTGGDGSNATFDVYRDGNGDVTSVNITTEGYDYNVGNTLTIDGGDVGGSSGTDDITITVDEVAGSTGSQNNFFGHYAGCSNTTGSYNNFFGRYAGSSNISGGYNNFFGRYAGCSNTTGCYNNFFGCSAGRYNTTGGNNNFFGCSAGRYNTTGGNNNFFGRSAGNSNTTGGYNNFFGCSAGRYNTTGGNNNFFGRYAGSSNISGGYNNFFGRYAGCSNTTGNYNNFFGCCAGRYNTTGGDNNFIGRSAGRSNTTGNHNTFLGSYSGISTSASRKVIFGSGYDFSNRFDAPDTTKDTQFAVGIRTDENPANYWLVGNENFNVGIGTTNPTSKLTVQGGDVKVGVNTSHGVILTSPNGTQYRLIVDNSGVLSTTSA